MSDETHEIEPGQLQALAQVFREQLVACLAEAAGGRRGLFSCYEHLGGDEEEQAWPEAARLRELALALQNIFAQSEEQNPLSDEFLDLCTIHGESNPGEARLARALLSRIEKDAVGTQSESERRPW